MIGGTTATSIEQMSYPVSVWSVARMQRSAIREALALILLYFFLMQPVPVSAKLQISGHFAGKNDTLFNRQIRS
ncbi:hypothetical protein [Rhodoferax sp.]|uniref:hypothetical protein n=1 Tax=Rhodoferax sp. TaxID=50421 RepID=UPI0027233AA7|nr:hypothetical protein [Rhodoferax sp.]MDO9146005.1 hypothetical protein [Rhodoferax sp.]MDP3191917.1 hypothetical protein [Rhodoferax sp.]MDP3336419.1 hypothetical protein [Rhodoferax sp.]MDP3863371.1 hypothetical protein [Rhodoferax sp.]